MGGKNQYDIPYQDGWVVKGVGNQRLTSVHDTQQQSIDVKHDIARSQKSQFVIHRPDCRIYVKDGHCNNSFLRRGEVVL